MYVVAYMDKCLGVLGLKYNIFIHIYAVLISGMKYIQQQPTANKTKPRKKLFTFHLPLVVMVVLENGLFLWCCNHSKPIYHDAYTVVVRAGTN